MSCGLDTDVSKSASQVESDSSLRVVHECETLLVASTMFSDDIRSDEVIEFYIRAEWFLAVFDWQKVDVDRKR